MKNRKLLLSVLLFAVMGMMTSTAISAPYIEGEQTGWAEIGPNNVAGRVRAAVFDKFNYGVLYAGTVGGLYVSVNNGKNWQEIELDGTVQNVTAITQSDDGTLYIGTGEGYYLKAFHNEDPTGHNNNPSGKIGSGVFKQNAGFDKEWAKNFSSDEEKYNYVKEKFTFTVMPATVPNDKYDVNDPWAFINALAWTNGTLYVGTKNDGLKYLASDGTFKDVTLGDMVTCEVYSMAVNSEGRLAVAFGGSTVNSAVALSKKEGNPDQFEVIFETKSLGLDGMAMTGRTALAFANSNPKDLFIMVASRGYSYIQDVEGYLYGIYRPADKEKGIDSVSTDASSWNRITYDAAYNGQTLSYAMSLYVDESGDNESIYMGGTYLMSGSDVNGEGTFSFSQVAIPYTTDTSFSVVPAHIHNILRIPNPANAVDSSMLIVTTDAGVYRYMYDTIVKVYQWWPASKGMNTLQSYKVAALPDGSVMAASQSNAIVYVPKVDNSIKAGEKIWSVNNGGYPYMSNPTANPYGYDFSHKTYSGSSVNPSSVYRTAPSVRKPVILARPGTNVTRTYATQGDFASINDQTWSYGHSDAQTLLPSVMAKNFVYDPFNTPIAFWESFNYAGTLDSIELKLNQYTTIQRKGKVLDCKDGREILEGDSVLVISDMLGDNYGYPFYHVFSASDVATLNGVEDSCYKLGSGDTLFFKNATMSIKVPQKIQSRVLIATNTGVFLCGKILDFARMINPDASSDDLAWVKIYHNGVGGADEETLNRRIRNIAMSADGASAFISIDHYSDNVYTNSELIRIDGINDQNLADRIKFQGIEDDATFFTQTTIGNFPRQISSIECDPTNANNMIITFDGYRSSAVNVKTTTNAKASVVTFKDMDLNPENLSDNKKPVFAAMYEKVGNTNRIYVGSDDGIYYSTGSSWTKDSNVPNVAVYDLWQQSKKLPQWNYTLHRDKSTDAVQYNAPANRGVIYAATYGKGLLVNNDYKDTQIDTMQAQDAIVSLQDVNSSEDNVALSIYPNPATSQATISYVLNTPSDVTFRMFDINGKEISAFEVSRQSKGAHSQILDVQNMVSGIYTVQMITKTSVSTTKLVVR